MMKRKITVMSLSLLGLAGCTSHLIFVEEANLGLKAKFEANNPAPAQVSVGYRRGVVAVIPQKSHAKASTSGTLRLPATEPAVTNTAVAGAGDGTKTVTIVANPNELMSMYSIFKANIGFNDPVRIQHFLATGTAASSLLANNNDLRNLTNALMNPGDQKGAGQ